MTERKGTIEYSVEDTEKDHSLVMRTEKDEKESVAKYDPKSGVVEMLPGKHNYKQMVINHLADKGYKFKEVAKIGADLEKTTKGAPKKPLKSRKDGQKTRQLVDWYARYQPEIFIPKYGVRQLQVLDKIEKHKRTIRRYGMPETTEIYEVKVWEDVDGLDYDVDKILDGKQRLIADSQTHLTYKVKEDEASGEYDDTLDQEEQDDVY